MDKNCIFEERRHLEDLLQQRFNFFIVMFSVGLAAAGDIEIGCVRGVCLIVVACVCALMSIPLWRAGRLAEKAVDLILQEYTDEGCALIRIRKAANIDAYGPRASRVMIYWVPTCCCTFLFILALLSFSIWK